MKAKIPAAHELLIRGIALVYVVAFGALTGQLLGLIGSQGILPVADYLSGVRAVLPGAERFWLVPTLCWINSSDPTLLFLVWGGLVCGLAAVAGFVAGPALLACWVFYLSLVTVGQDFLSFQWDSLLLEVGFLAVLAAPWTVRMPVDDAERKPRQIIFVWMLRLVLFKLMLLSGIVKLSSGDQTWWHLDALHFHYETQPLPTPLAWWANLLPDEVDRVCTFVMFVIELFVPFLMLGTYRVRLVAAIATVALQLGILLTGNYTFFNLLTIILCLSLLDRSKLPAKFVPSYVLAAALLVSNLVRFEFVEPLRIVNQYGLFAVMTTSRPELTVQGSDDGENWKDYVFKFKPGPLDRAPPIVAPMHPRLDWQMWFAALGSPGQSPWLFQFCRRLLESDRAVTELLAINPFPDKPPKFVRVLRSNYHFTTFEQLQKTGRWWNSDEEELFVPPIQIQEGGE